MMNIDILPTIAELTHAKLPDHEIDGKNVWDIWTGSSTESAQEAYFFYYNVNELHGVRYNHWKMYFPHRYRTLNGKPGGTDGFPVAYEQDTLLQIELYNLNDDIGEQLDVADQHPEVIAEINALAQRMRGKLGDSLLDVKGSDNRTAGSRK